MNIHLITVCVLVCVYMYMRKNT